MANSWKFLISFAPDLLILADSLQHHLVLPNLWSQSNALIRAGWRKDSLKRGDEVIVEGYRSKDGSNTVNGTSKRLPDGRKLLAGSSKDGNAVK
jgi:Family of unknown function (DUF6152)